MLRKKIGSAVRHSQDYIRGTAALYSTVTDFARFLG